VAGFVLFLTIKSRLLTHLALTAISIVLLMLLMWSAV